ncbi:DNA translocase FtsK [Candidatus Wolfebacteria bacterium]|nr:DNA translocase FtsK [Candidatus Wolfebacteria bacterium]
MRRKKKVKTSVKKSLLQEFNELRSLIHPETEKSILAIIFIGFSAILILASFHNAGPAGEFIYEILTKLFGFGYYLFPAVFLIISGVFLSGREQKEKGFTMTFLGASLMVIAGLGLIDIVYPDKGGLVGRWFGSIEQPFGYVAGIVIAITVLVIALLLTINLPLRLRLRLSKDEEEVPKIIIKNPEAFPSTPEKEEERSKKNKKYEEVKEQDKDEEVKEIKEDDLKVESPKAFFTPHTAKSSEAIKDYTAPPVSLLKSTIEKPTSGDLRANANIIKRTLDSFGIPVEMGEITIGPKVTRYTLKPAEGIKLSRILALNQDLALALAAHPIRIEAPIPGKSLVGIEVPNKSAAIVRLGSLMAYPEFTGSGKLAFILGRDVSGEPIIADIKKMPHMLVAGSTGSGKSVSIHTIVTSLLYKNSPETLRMVMIDPKRVELTIYNGIPHLIAPVITDGKKALGVFRWAIDEMENRYERLQQAGARDIESYNKNNRDEQMPYILILVDELADLMAAYGRDIESSIVRLAQMARATGIHLILSTQRPSVEVITGLIKANITARVALQVASQVDSRTILDTAGAEKLLGGGDMLFINSSLSKPKRIQGAFISEEEIHKVAKFIRDNNKPSKENEEGEKVDFGPKEPNRIEIKEGIDFTKYSKEDDDDLYEEAVNVVRNAQKASASLLQRRLSIGYARAARLLDIMEDRGVIGPGEGAKPREVYLDKENSNVEKEF